MDRRQANLAVLGQSKVLEKLQSLLGVDLTMSEAIRLFDIATRIERVARGEPESIERREHSGPGGGPIPVREIVVELPPDEPTDESLDD